MLSKRQREILEKKEEIKDEYRAVLRYRIGEKVWQAMKDLQLIIENIDIIVDSDPYCYPGGNRKEVLRDLFYPQSKDFQKLKSTMEDFQKL